MLVVFDHLKSKYSLVPDGINVMNEPDLARWTPASMGRVMVKTAARLSAAGYHADFIVPSTKDRGRAIDFLDGIVAVPGASSLVKELSYHCYSDSRTNSLETINERASRYGLRITMNECWLASCTYRTLHRDLKDGMVAAWQQGPLNGRPGYYVVDRNSWQVSLNPKTKLMRQYYKYIRPGD